MDDENLYDEFGNYIGPDLLNEENNENDNEKSFNSHSESLEDEEEVSENPLHRLKDVKEHQIILHEDKKYFPELEEAYPNAETLIMEEDAQPITQPIIEPIKSKNFDFTQKEIPQTTFSFEFLASMMSKPELIRNVGIVGHLHHGKTTLMDLFVQQTHLLNFKLDKNNNFTDTRRDEKERLLSIKSTPMSMILSDSREKSYLVNLYDTPGHPNFSDEVCSALRVCDGVLVVVDVVEGVMIGTERWLQYLLQENIAITIVINKIDRLILELRLPPADAYLKIKHTLEEINGIISTANLSPERAEKLRISPVLGNVAFASSLYGFVFTLSSFARMYSRVYGINEETFVKLLWGDSYYDPATRKFSKQASKECNTRTFVEFILEPLYKLFAHSVSKEMQELQPILSKLGVYLRKDEYKLDMKELLRLICSKFFGPTNPVVDMMVRHIPNSLTGSRIKVQTSYQGQRDTAVYEKLLLCDPNANLVVNIVKLYNKPDCLSFDAFGRVFSGTIHKNETVKVLGEKYSLEDEEDMSLKTVKNLWVFEGSYRVEVNKVMAGNWVLIEGIEQSISKSATVISSKDSESIEIFKPIKHNANSVVKIACEPLIPSELPKMLEGIRKINKSYPLLKTKVEESGEHILIGTGELYLDCALHDLRQLYGEIEVKVSDPCVSFCETVIDTSAIKCYAETPNKKNKIAFIAEPLDKGLAEDIEREFIDVKWEAKKLSSYLEKKYEWDILSSRSVWAFGPDSFGPNVLLDDTLPSETNKSLLFDVKESLIQGFQWSCREGPLCDEPTRNVKFKVIEAQIAHEGIFRGGGQMIPTARRVCYSSFLMATPRMMEPMFLSEILCTGDSLNAIYTVLQRRRGHVVLEMAKPGTPLYTVKAHVPALDSFGFETDLRIHTSGQAFCLSVFDHWALLPGDPLDKSIVLKLLEPSPPPHLARELMIKTRRRKGLNEDVSIVKFFDDPGLLDALRTDEDFKNYFDK